METNHQDDLHRNTHTWLIVCNCEVFPRTTVIGEDRCVCPDRQTVLRWRISERTHTRHLTLSQKQLTGSFPNSTLTFFFIIPNVAFAAPTSSLWRNIARARLVAPPRNPRSVSPLRSASAMPPSWTRPTTWLRSCFRPACPWCSRSQWGTTRATVVSGTLRCPQPRATASTSRLWAEPMGWVLAPWFPLAEVSYSKRSSVQKPL